MAFLSCAQNGDSDVFACAIGNNVRKLVRNLITLSVRGR